MNNTKNIMQGVRATSFFILGSRAVLIFVFYSSKHAYNPSFVIFYQSIRNLGTYCGKDKKKKNEQT